MFHERLEQVIDRIDDAKALSLVARDGIPVDSVIRDETVDMEILAAELMSQVRAVAQNHQELAVGTVRNFSVTTDQLGLMVNALTDEYFLLLVLGTETNVGRARFELRRSILLFEDDLL